MSQQSFIGMGPNEENPGGGSAGADRTREVKAMDSIPARKPANNSEAEMTEAKAWFDRNMRRVKLVGRFAEFVEITPAMAAVLIAQNPRNRPISDGSVREWSEALSSGDWELNGETIIVAETGELNDGQHRLKAVIRTGISLPTLIVFGVTRKSQKSLNVGKRRNASHVLGMREEEKVPQTALTAAALKFLLNLQSGAYIEKHRTSQEIERAYEVNSDISTSFGLPTKAARQFAQSQGVFVALHYMMAQRSWRHAQEFFQLLADGTAPDKHHPTALLRACLTENLRTKAKLPKTEVAALTIKAWNYFHSGKWAKSLRWRTGGDKAEAFPKVL